MYKITVKATKIFMIEIELVHKKAIKQRKENYKVIIRMCV